MAESGSKLSGSSAIATAGSIDRGQRYDDGDDASNESELGSTGSGRVGERVEVRSCGCWSCGDKEGVVAISAVLNFAGQPSHRCCVYFQKWRIKYVRGTCT